MDAGEVYALSRTSKEVQASFEEYGVYHKLAFARAFCAAAYWRKSRTWTYEDAVRVYEDVACTPYKTKTNIVRHLFYRTMDEEHLYVLGVLHTNLLAMRLAMRKARRRTARWSSKFVQESV